MLGLAIGERLVARGRPRVLGLRLGEACAAIVRGAVTHLHAFRLVAEGEDLVLLLQRVEAAQPPRGGPDAGQKGEGDDVRSFHGGL